MDALLKTRFTLSDWDVHSSSVKTVVCYQCITDLLVTNFSWSRVLCHIGIKPVHSIPPMTHLQGEKECKYLAPLLSSGINVKAYSSSLVEVFAVTAS